jgi:hypothetical protein
MAPYLLKRSGHYYLRLTIPLGLRSWFDGKRELKKSLLTTRYDVAKGSARAHLYKAQRLFAAIRGGTMDEAQIKKLVSEYLSQTLKESLEARIEAPPLSPEGLEEQLYLHETQLHEAGQDLAEGRHLKLAHVADIVLEAAGVSIPKESSEYRRLCHELLRGIYEVVMPTEIERLKGNYRSEHDRESPTVAPSTINQPEEKAEEKGEPLSKLIKEFIAERVKGGRWRGRTKAQGDGSLKLFLKIVGGGDRGIKTLDRRALAGYRDVLTRFPVHTSVSRR